MRLGDAFALTIMTTAAAAAAPASTGSLRTYGNLPLRFEANAGQTDPRVDFLARGPGYTLFLTPTETVLALPQDVVRLRLVGANPDPRAEPLDRLPGVTHYYVGRDAERWRTNVPAYAKVQYRNVYRGIDLVFYGNRSKVEYDFVVAPGARPDAIAFDVAGASGLRLEPDGDLAVDVAGGGLELKRPVAYQVRDGRRTEVRSAYALAGGSRVRLSVGDYDRTRPLVIDPVVDYATYLGGNGFDVATRIAVDAGGNAYVTGITGSTNFPTTGGPPFGGGSNSPPVGPTDAFVTKLDPSGGALVYSVYLGGADNEFTWGVAVDGSGRAHVSGGTNSSNFPTTAGSYQPTYGGNRDVFVARLEADGTLGWATFLGGSCTDEASGIALDGAGRVFVTGQTEDDVSDPTCATVPFPVTPGAYQTTHQKGIGDVFVSRLSASGAALEYSTLLGGTETEVGRAITVDGSGNAIVSGSTESTNFPLQNPIQSTFGPAGCFRSFVTKLNPTGTALVYSTLLGGTSNCSDGDSVAVDAAGVAHVGGTTNANDLQVTNGSTRAGESDAYLVKIGSSGGLLFGTYFGGSASEVGTVAIDGAGEAYLAGYTGSADFPVREAFQPTFAGGAGLFFCESDVDPCDAFVAKFSRVGRLVYSSYLGSATGGDSAMALAVDGNGRAYVVGATTGTDFPTTAGAFQEDATAKGPFAPSYWGFVARIGPSDLIFEDGFED